MVEKKSINKNKNNTTIEKSVATPTNEFDNIFKENYAIILNPVPYLKRVIFDIPRRMVGNHIILFMKGTALATINFKEYPIKAGDILMVPDNYILFINQFSEDATPWIASCNFNSPVEKELMGIETTFMHLNEEDLKIVTNYFTLMHTIAAKSIYDSNDFKHLILSLMYKIHEMYNEQYGQVNNITRISNSKQLAARFINMMVQEDVNKLNIKYFAKALGVSENHLSVTVKKETNITVKKWIDRKTEAIMRMLLIDETKCSLEEICSIIGYSSPPQAVRFFKRRTGMTPFEFRRAKLAEKALLSL